MPIPRTVIASLIAPLGALAPLLLLAAWEVSQPVQMIAGEPDDAPIRSFGVLLLALPLIYVVMSIVAFAGGLTLRRVGLRSFKSFMGASAALAFALAIIVGLSSGQPQLFGVQDSLFAVAAFSGLFLICVAPGAACWWYLTRSDA